MEFQRLFELGECPIMFSGGECGMVIRWDDICNEIGIQIPDDDNIRWVHTSKVTDCGNGALLVSEPTGCPFCGEQVTLAINSLEVTRATVSKMRALSR